MLTSDNISEAMRLIDGRRLLDITSNTLQSDTEMSSACDVVLSNPSKGIESTNHNSDWEHLLTTNPQVETLLNKAASHREPHVTTPTNSISTMHAGRTPYIHHSVAPSGSPTTTD
uniref:Uncharacterized protein n=1 Tax=Ciona savignyi TaxID=51511 RepID=H2Z5B7_CIOSA